MKRTLTASGILNVLLLAGLLLFWLNRREAVAPLPSTTPSAPPPAVVSPVPVVQAETVKTVPFQWSRLDAADYHVYVKNLRAIGCPEATLRAIVTADVHAAYDIRINALKKRLSDLSGQIGNLNTETALQNELREIPDHEAAEIADLLGLQSSPPAEIASASTADDNTQNQDQPPAAMPLVFQNIDPVALGLSDEQMDAVNKLRQSFVDKVGGPNQDPNDPAYLARWQQAQPWADVMLRGTLGSETYSKYLLLQVKSENQPAPAE